MAMLGDPSALAVRQRDTSQPLQTPVSTPAPTAADSTDDSDCSINIFDLMLHENLHRLLGSAFTFTCDTVSQWYPTSPLMDALQRWSRELFLGVDVLLQYQSLHKHQASFAEHFYALTRTPAPQQPLGHTEPLLGKRHILRSLIGLCLVPYVRAKLDKYYEDYIQHETTPSSRPTYTQPLSVRVRGVIRALYPFLRSLWDFIQFIYQLLYLCGRVRYHSPLLHYAGVTLTYADPVTPPTDPSTVGGRMRDVFRVGFSTMASSFAGSVSVGSFLLQFLEWWHQNEDYRSQIKLQALPIPPPPTLPPSPLPPSDPTQCPLCNRVRTSDAVLSTSGYVFCYQCIYTQIDTNHKCPITGYPSTTDQIILLHHTNNSTV